MNQASRLYLMVSTADDLTAAADHLAKTLADIDAACVELDLQDLQDLPDAAWDPAISALRPIAQDRGVAFLLRGRARLAAATGCDGVRVSCLDEYHAARRALGQGIVGVDAGASRHAAMLAGEAEADFVGLGPPPGGGAAVDLVQWWAELMEVPGVAFGADAADAVWMLAAAGADFVAIDQRLWRPPADPLAIATAAGAARPSLRDG